MWITAILMLLWLAVAAHAGPLEDCFEQVQDFDRRIHGCTDRIRQFPRDATAFFNRGAAYLSKGDLDHAIADYTAVIQIDPAYSPATTTAASPTGAGSSTIRPSPTSARRSRSIPGMAGPSTPARAST